jgi:UDP-N-acetylglucosamine--N-acetylmuramyl-(pentapeptide) pyrophosphoryl-undecaprenol N-acetylglucosamine transferase
MKRWVFSSGGSGGHLAPAIALSQILHQTGDASVILTTEKQIDQEMRSRYPELRFVGIPSLPPGKSPAGMLRFAVTFFKSVGTALNCLHQNRCTHLMATGGFGCAPAMAAAILLGLRMHAHESNAVAGKVVRLFSPWLDALFVTGLYRSKGTPWACPTFKAGLPLRGDLQRLPPESAKKQLGMPANQAILGVLGGSQGAQSLNRIALEWARSEQSNGWKILCICGPAKAGLPDANAIPERMILLPFVRDMAACYGACDRIVARSGAGTLAEIAAFQVPSLLIPLPHSADDHQRLNALHFSDNEAAWVEAESTMNIDSLTRLTEQADPVRLSKMKAALKAWHQASNQNFWGPWLKAGRSQAWI